jgi:hypothetical protein
MTRITLLLLLFTSLINAQMADTYDLKAYDKDDGVHVYFKNNNSDGFYLDGKFMYSYGKIILSTEEFLAMLEQAAKLIRKSSGFVDNSSYTLEKFDFADDEVYLGVKEKVGTLTKSKLKELRNRYED